MLPGLSSVAMASVLGAGSGVGAIPQLRQPFATCCRPQPSSITNQMPPIAAPPQVSPPMPAPIPNPTADESALLALGQGNPALTSALTEIILALRNYQGPGISFQLFGEGYCHRWVQGGILDRINAIADNYQTEITGVRYITPAYSGPIYIYRDHALIRVWLSTGDVFYIDRAMVGGSDHIQGQRAL